MHAVAADSADRDAIAGLHQAVGLWRGRPLGALGAEPPFVAFAAELEALHVRALASLAHQHMDANETDSAARLLLAGIGDHPHDSELVALAMQALHRQGRPDAAIAAYRTFADRLERDLGVIPDDRLEQLAAEVAAGLSSTPVPQRPGRARAQRRVGNVPTSHDSFVGRADDLARLGLALDRHRWVTLVGPPGVGTSRLGAEAARREAGRFAGGVRYADIGSARAGADLLDTLIEGWQVATQPGVDPTRSLVRALRGRGPSLLLLDAVVHPGSTSLRVLADLVERVDGLTVMVASHAPLDAPDEHVVRIDPLPLPPDGGHLIDGAAGRLLLDRATREAPGRALTPETEESLVRVVRRLDGLPLALELAAAQLAVLGPDELERRLDDRFAVLVAPGRSGGYVSLQASVAAVVDDLDDLPRAVLQRISVAGTALSMRRAERLVADLCPSARTATRVIQELARRALLVVDDDRVWVLESIRDYCVDSAR